MLLFFMENKRKWAHCQMLQCSPHYLYSWKHCVRNTRKLTRLDPKGLWLKYYAPVHSPGAAHIRCVWENLRLGNIIKMNQALNHFWSHTGWIRPREPPENGERSEMTLPSRRKNRDSNPRGLRPSTLPLGHGGSPQFSKINTRYNNEHIESWIHKTHSMNRAVNKQ